MASSTTKSKPEKKRNPSEGSSGVLSSDYETGHESGHQSPPLSDKLKIFKSSQFDPDAYLTSKCQTLSEKDIRRLCSHLHDLRKASAEEMRKSVYSNYAAFIRTSKGISDLEGELLSIRNLLSNQAALVHGLADGVNMDALSTDTNDSMLDDIPNFEQSHSSKVEKWCSEFPDALEVLLAERRVDEALATLDQAVNVAKEAYQKKTLIPSVLLSLKTAISEHRQKLADLLVEAACQPSTRGAELRMDILALKKLGGPSFQYNMQSLRPSSTSYGRAFTAVLSQLVFSSIAQAADDSLAVFGEEPVYTSELVTWSIDLTETLALLVKRHALSASVAAGRLRAAAECVQIALDHCSLLESRGLALCPVLLRLFRLSVEQALDANLKRIEESSAALAAADDWVLTYPPAGTRLPGRSATTSIGSLIASQPKLSSSAHRFNSMVQEFFEDVGPIINMQLGGTTLEGLLRVFMAYVNLLITALPVNQRKPSYSFIFSLLIFSYSEYSNNLEGSENKIVRMAETESQQMALLANASLLADELLPRAFMKLSSQIQVGGKDELPRGASDRQNRGPEQREWKKRLQRSVDRLRDTFCRQHALELIFTEDEEHEWFPSPIFQEVFAKVSTMATIAADMFVGRERFATILLMRLTETVIMWLSNDQTFWEEVEAGPRPMRPLGLQQFYLDMEFVTLFASQGRYLSLNLHQVIKDIIARVLEAYAT
ncbi:hypothetical protein MKX01_022108 [Papaver californicum]|nr:hypothetical protein MKX01_022108 [Papaver californicum]